MAQKRRLRKQTLDAITEHHRPTENVIWPVCKPQKAIVNFMHISDLVGTNCLHTQLISTWCQWCKSNEKWVFSRRQTQPAVSYTRDTRLVAHKWTINFSKKPIGPSRPKHSLKSNNSRFVQSEHSFGYRNQSAHDQSCFGANFDQTWLQLV